MRVFGAIAVLVTFLAATPALAESPLPSSAPTVAQTSRRAGIASVFRVICSATQSEGSGFLHRSGNVISSEHVVRGCQQVTLRLPNNNEVVGEVLRADRVRDLALIAPTTRIRAPLFSISAATSVEVGSQIAFWGFPGGYNDAPPLFGAGYVAGLTYTATAGGRRPQWVLNAAINQGNSGGPVVLVETGEVIGVAVSKMAPLSPASKAMLDELDGQPIGLLLKELRGQVQLVVGTAVMLGDLQGFLSESGIAP
ncbi:serine protease [uncultured Phenylobacterium sp.]|uniref:S1 family peptidase n=1 Tax=uncultured Phenylobacterium sp. TaxID=349273 RepID=UPI0025F687DE|nr:serine protease [uncultured Phenylobacterium sp.]